MRGGGGGDSPIDLVLLGAKPFSPKQAPSRTHKRTSPPLFWDVQPFWRTRTVAIFITDPLNLPLNHTLSHTNSLVRHTLQLLLLLLFFCLVFFTLFYFSLSFVNLFAAQSQLVRKGRGKKYKLFLLLNSLTLSHTHTAANNWCQMMFLRRFFFLFNFLLSFLPNCRQRPVYSASISISHGFSLLDDEKQ